jgi:hypothetical protein
MTISQPTFVLRAPFSACSSRLRALRVFVGTISVISSSRGRVSLREGEKLKSRTGRPNVAATNRD